MNYFSLTFLQTHDLLKRASIGVVAFVDVWHVGSFGLVLVLLLFYIALLRRQ